MRTIIKYLLQLFSVSDPKDYLEIGRNEVCYCKSGKKYKQCHMTLLQKKGLIALWEIDLKSGKKKLKKYSERKYKGINTRMKTNLRGVDVKATDIALNDYNEQTSKIYNS